MNATIPSTDGGPLHARFDGPIVMIGFGSIGKGTLPLIERHIAFDRARFVVIAPDDSDRRLLDERQIRFIHRGLTKENYCEILTPLLTTGPGRGMIVNLSVDTSSVDLMEFCKDLDAFYIDTVVEPWPGMQRAGVKGIHIAERDTQRARDPKPRGKFVNTWSVEGFLAEGLQPSELGWGTHEKTMPAGAFRHTSGCDAAIYLTRPGAGTRVRSWTPTAQAQHGFLVTHNESISIADYFTLREGRKVIYRPTCHYAYHPCDDAVLSLHELAGAQWKPQQTWHILSEDDIVDGIDELGVLLYGHAKNAYWYGSQLSIEETRRLAPYQNATGLQVTSAVLAGIVWMLENPERGIVEADEMDFRRCLDLQRPYLGPVTGCYTDWTPLVGRNELFPETLDTSDPWQFTNVLVN